jgi:Mitochondrial carrier protein
MKRSSFCAFFLGALLLIEHNATIAFIVPQRSHQVPLMKPSDDESHLQQPLAPDFDETVHTMDQSRRRMLDILLAGTLVVAATPDDAVATTDTVLKQPEELDSELLSLTVDWETILKKASKKALGGGKAGAAAAVVQVCSLMWMRTAMNYQYRYGGDLGSSLKTLWAEGGIQRLYQGLPFALVQGPLTRFGDTAANVGILSLLDGLEATSGLPLPFKTAAGSAAAGAFRIFLMPIDTSKTAMQVEGADGLQRLWTKVLSEGPGPLYQGALASAAATAAGHFPWFLTYNALDAQLPMVTASDDLLLSLLRSATLGLCASCVSDCVSNSLRVVKTTKQTAGLSVDVADSENKKELSYPEIVAMIIEKDGIAGLLGRGLQTRLLTNAIQGGVFSVIWRYFQQVGGSQ